MRILTTAYIADYAARVSVSKGSLIVRRPGSTTRIPIRSIEGLVLLGGQVSMEAVDLCVRHGVRVAALRRSGRLRFAVGFPTSGNVLLRVEQVRASDDMARTAAIARAVVAGKLTSYRRMLQRWAQDATGTRAYVFRTEAEAVAESLRSLGTSLDGDRIRGIEGDGTRRYFKGLGLALEPAGEVGRFLARTRRPPRDPANALLSFLYGVMLAETIGAAEAVGLDPQIGFLHRLRPGRPSLALDLLEELRPLADRTAVRLLRRRELRLEHFTRTGAGAWYLTEEGRRVVLEAHEADRARSLPHPLLDRDVDRWTLPILQATLLARHLRGDLPAYPAYAML